MNEQNIQFLTKIYQNAKTGCDSISYVSEKTQDADFRDSLLKQHAQYSQVVTDAAEMLNAEGEPAKDSGVISKAMLWSGVQMNTLTDRTPNHLAEMMMQGSMMGIIDMARSARQFEAADGKIKKLGETLIETEEKNIQRMKAFLC